MNSDRKYCTPYIRLKSVYSDAIDSETIEKSHCVPFPTANI